MGMKKRISAYIFRHKRALREEELREWVWVSHETGIGLEEFEALSGDDRQAIMSAVVDNGRDR